MDTLDAIVSGEYTRIETRPSGYRMKPTASRILCRDGESLSVQASRSHYCRPRNDFGPYDAVEVGYPSMRPPNSWEKYFDGYWQHPNIAIEIGPRIRIVFPTGSLKRVWEERQMVWHTFKNGVQSEKAKLEVIRKWARSGFGAMRAMRFHPRYSMHIAGRTVSYAFKEVKKTKGRWMSFRHWTSLVDNACDSVYGYVPVEMVREFIDGHGGEFNWHLME